jgi:hypothetical protein
MTRSCFFTMPTTTPVSRGNPKVRILLSLGMLAVMLYIVIREGKPLKKAPAVPNFRSSAPSSEGEHSFAWIPRYPGAEVNNIRTRETEKELTYGFEFQTVDAPTAVADYYERGLRAAGLTVNTRRPSGDETNIHGESSSPARMIDVGIDKVQTGSFISVGATQK